MKPGRMFGELNSLVETTARYLLPKSFLSWIYGSALLVLGACSSNSLVQDPPLARQPDLASVNSEADLEEDELTVFYAAV